MKRVISVNRMYKPTLDCDRSTGTEDGGMAMKYQGLTEVITEDDKYKDQYLFVHRENAEKFINSLEGNTND